ncbi:hypothetical protein C5N14_04510 [Micromonospora sp. MW-13]|uniref:hypothetical protein n=1 Tax=unclassified Micromonospora TaxID=2617518 RepID=UPI000E44F93F|nr:MULTISPECIES: hypothetical protein [unclassified Micromonospora]MCX4474222.1 hypothetical protein [Micromonospora sp. NBC_01655]RGC69668.1 hypothetical protein C5N14_04510 [Micromonospora sp. MW-13]
MTGSGPAAPASTDADRRWQWLTGDRPPAEAGGDARWWEAARTARAAAEELSQVQRALPEHWRAGEGRDECDERLRRLVHRLEEAHETYRIVAEALAARADGWTLARRTVREAVAQAHRAGLVVAPDGTVTSPTTAVPTMAVRALARRLSATVVTALARLDAVESRAADLIATVSPPR